MTESLNPRDVLAVLHSGKLYDPCFKELMEEQAKAKLALDEFNHLRVKDYARIPELLPAFLGQVGANCYIEPPFRANFGGKFISLGNNVYINFDFCAVDDTHIEIGDNVMIGPRVIVATAIHPENAEQRRRGLQYNRKVVIKANVWIGAGAILLPGVTIGENSIIGAGAVVTHDVPANVVAVGNPCRVLRPVRDEKMPEVSPGQG